MKGGQPLGIAEVDVDRVRLAACVRLLHMEGLLTYNGHVSVRDWHADAFLIHSLNDPRADASPELLLSAGSRSGGRNQLQACSPVKASWTIFSSAAAAPTPTWLSSTTIYLPDR